MELISLPFGGLGLAPGVLLGLFVVIAVLAVVAAIGRRRRDRAPRERRHASPAPRSSARCARALRLARCHSRLSDRQSLRRRRQGRRGSRPTVEQALARTRAAACAVCDTRDLDHARELAAGRRPGETVVALSGDGMLGALADALREIPGSVLGVLPGGRGNDLARVLGISDDPVAACATIAHGAAAAIDLGAVVDAGRGPWAARSSGSPRRASTATPTASPTRRPSWLGELVYAYGALRALLAWRPARFEIELDPPGERRVVQRLLRRRLQLQGLRRRHARGARCAARRRPARDRDPRTRQQARVPGEDPAEGLQGHPRAASPE